MGPAPADIGYTLPSEWQERTTALVLDAPAQSLVRKLQAVIATLGERSLVLEHVQELALIACGLKRWERSPWSQILDRLSRLQSQAQSSWVVENVLDEQDWSRKSIHNVGKDIYSMEAEWLVLGRLMDLGWTPEERPREGNPDWHLSRRSSAISVEVKNKHALGSCRHRLTWLLRGISMIPAFQFTKAFRWRWIAADDLLDQDVNTFVEELFPRIQVLEEFFAVSVPDETQTHGALQFTNIGEGEHALEYQGTNGHRIILYATYLGPRSRYFSPGSVETAWPERELTDDDRERLMLNFSRLRIQRCADLVCIVWPVPWHWPISDEWIAQTVVALEAVWGQRAGILWPLVWSSEGGDPIWYMNGRATSLLAVGPEPL